MKNLVWIILLILALIIGWYLGRSAQPPADERPEEPQTEPGESAAMGDYGWLDIAVGVEYAGGSIIPPARAPHDTAVLQEEVDFDLVVDCESCPRGDADRSLWRIDKFVRVADLTRVADTLIEMYNDKSIECAPRADLGLFEEEEEVEVDFPSRPVPVGTPITARVEDPISSGGELWKHYLEISTCDSTLVEDCSQEAESWTPLDPHIWAHQRNS